VVWVRAERRLDELIRQVRAVVLRDVDVINAEFERPPQDSERLVAVARRPEYAWTWQLHRAEADTGNRPRAGGVALHLSDLC